MTKIGIAIVEHQGMFLVGLRSPETSLAGYHEFPGGKQQLGEDSATTAMRECLEETGLEVSALQLIHQTTFQYEHDHVQLDFWLCELKENDAAIELLPPWRWVARSDLATLNFPPANSKIIELLRHFEAT